jgi:hypothetical protein
MGDPPLRDSLNRLPAQRIPPTHDYIRQHVAGAKDGPGDPTVAGGDADWAGPATGRAGAAPFVHLHVHSNFSFLDGGSRIEELVARAAELGQPALALTDHDGLYGAVRFAKACAKHGIKPIFGAEVRVESRVVRNRGGGPPPPRPPPPPGSRRAGPARTELPAASLASGAVWRAPWAG